VNVALSVRTAQPGNRCYTLSMGTKWLCERMSEMVRLGFQEFHVRNMYLTRPIRVRYYESNENEATNFYSVCVSRRTLKLYGFEEESERTIYFLLILKAIFDNAKYECK
jgi:hypothetical protein